MLFKLALEEGPNPNPVLASDPIMLGRLSPLSRDDCHLPYDKRKGEEQDSPRLQTASGTEE